MPKTSLTDIRGLVDPLFGYAFDLIIPNVPGGGNARDLSIKVMTTSIPGVSLDDVTVTETQVVANPGTNRVAVDVPYPILTSRARGCRTRTR